MGDNRLETRVLPLTVIQWKELIPACIGAFQKNLCEQFFMLDDTVPIHDAGCRHLKNKRFSKHAQVVS